MLETDNDTKNIDLEGFDTVNLLDQILDSTSFAGEFDSRADLHDLDVDEISALTEIINNLITNNSGDIDEDELDNLTEIVSTLEKFTDGVGNDQEEIDAALYNYGGSSYADKTVEEISAEFSDHEYGDNAAELPIALVELFGRPTTDIQPKSAINGILKNLAVDEFEVMLLTVISGDYFENSEDLDAFILEMMNIYFSRPGGTNNYTIGDPDGSLAIDADDADDGVSTIDKSEAFARIADTVFEGVSGAENGIYNAFQSESFEGLEEDEQNIRGSLAQAISQSDYYLNKAGGTDRTFTFQDDVLNALIAQSNEPPKDGEMLPGGDAVDNLINLYEANDLAGIVAIFEAEDINNNVELLSALIESEKLGANTAAIVAELTNLLIDSAENKDEAVYAISNVVGSDNTDPRVKAVLASALILNDYYRNSFNPGSGEKQRVYNILNDALILHQDGASHLFRSAESVILDEFDGASREAIFDENGKIRDVFLTAGGEDVDLGILSDLAEKALTLRDGYGENSKTKVQQVTEVLLAVPTEFQAQFIAELLEKMGGTDPVTGEKLFTDEQFEDLQRILFAQLLISLMDADNTTSSDEFEKILEDFDQDLLDEYGFNESKIPSGVTENKDWLFEVFTQDDNIANLYSDSAWSENISFENQRYYGDLINSIISKSEEIPSDSETLEELIALYEAGNLDAIGEIFEAGDVSDNVALLSALIESERFGANTAAIVTELTNLLIDNAQDKDEAFYAIVNAVEDENPRGKAVLASALSLSEFFRDGFFPDSENQRLDELFEQTLNQYQDSARDLFRSSESVIADEFGGQDIYDADGKIKEELIGSDYNFADLADAALTIRDGYGENSETKLQQVTEVLLAIPTQFQAQFIAELLEKMGGTDPVTGEKLFTDEQFEDLQRILFAQLLISFMDPDNTTSSDEIENILEDFDQDLLNEYGFDESNIPAGVIENKDWIFEVFTEDENIANLFSDSPWSENVNSENQSYYSDLINAVIAKSEAIPSEDETPNETPPNDEDEMTNAPSDYRYDLKAVLSKLLDSDDATKDIDLEGFDNIDLLDHILHTATFGNEFKSRADIHDLDVNEVSKIVDIINSLIDTLDADTLDDEQLASLMEIVQTLGTYVDGENDQNEINDALDRSDITKFDAMSAGEIRAEIIGENGDEHEYGESFVELPSALVALFGKLDGDDKDMMSQNAINDILEQLAVDEFELMLISVISGDYFEDSEELDAFLLEMMNVFFARAGEENDIYTVGEGDDISSINKAEAFERIAETVFQGVTRQNSDDEYVDFDLSEFTDLDSGEQLIRGRLAKAISESNYYLNKAGAENREYPFEDDALDALLVAYSDNASGVKNLIELYESGDVDAISDLFARLGSEEVKALLAALIESEELGANTAVAVTELVAIYVDQASDKDDAIRDIVSVIEDDETDPRTRAVLASAISLNTYYREDFDAGSEKEADRINDELIGALVSYQPEARDLFRSADSVIIDEFFSAEEDAIYDENGKINNDFFKLVGSGDLNMDVFTDLAKAALTIRDGYGDGAKTKVGQITEVLNSVPPEYQIQMISELLDQMGGTDPVTGEKLLTEDQFNDLQEILFAQLFVSFMAADNDTTSQEVADVLVKFDQDLLDKYGYDEEKVDTDADNDRRGWLFDVFAEGESIINLYANSAWTENIPPEDSDLRYGYYTGLIGAVASEASRAENHIFYEHQHGDAPEAHYDPVYLPVNPGHGWHPGGGYNPGGYNAGGWGGTGWGAGGGSGWGTGWGGLGGGIGSVMYPNQFGIGPGQLPGVNRTFNPSFNGGMPNYGFPTNGFAHNMSQQFSNVLGFASGLGMPYLGGGMIRI
ncbi:MAG: hypothetical protein AAF621_02630 [Pseudomonadota bacterium]